jgi:hypothetical protein
MFWSIVFWLVVCASAGTASPQINDNRINIVRSFPYSAISFSPKVIKFKKYIIVNDLLVMKKSETHLFNQLRANYNNAPELLCHRHQRQIQW